MATNPVSIKLSDEELNSLKSQITDKKRLSDIIRERLFEGVVFSDFVKKFLSLYADKIGLSVEQVAERIILRYMADEEALRKVPNVKPGKAYLEFMHYEGQNMSPQEVFHNLLNVQVQELEREKKRQYTEEVERAKQHGLDEHFILQIKDKYYPEDSNY